MSIGIEYNGNWKTCVMENGQVLALHAFADAKAAFSSLEQVGRSSLQPIIIVASPFRNASAIVHSAVEHRLPLTGNASDNAALQAFLSSTGTIHLSTSIAEGVKSLASVPRHRKLYHRDMGSSYTLCSVATLVYRMRQQQADWLEMRFLYLEIDHCNWSISVINDGQIVDGTSKTLVPYVNERDSQPSEDESVLEEAFWEGLTQDLAGFIAIHHFEDVVVLDHHPSESDLSRKYAVMEHFKDLYQFYHFPSNESEPEGFEATIGAAIIAEGLSHSGLAAEVVERLQIRP